MLKQSLTAVATLALAAAGLATPVAAAPHSVAVKIGDLDLSTASGNAQLQRRLRSAANEICGVVPVLPLRNKAMAEACHDDVLASSADQVALARARAADQVQLARRDK